MFPFIYFFVCRFCEGNPAKLYEDNRGIMINKNSLVQFTFLYPILWKAHGYSMYEYSPFSKCCTHISKYTMTSFLFLIKHFLSCYNCCGWSSIVQPCIEGEWRMSLSEPAVRRWESLWRRIASEIIQIIYTVWNTSIRYGNLSYTYNYLFSNS